MPKKKKKTIVHTYIVPGAESSNASRPRTNAINQDLRVINLEKPDMTWEEKNKKGGMKKYVQETLHKPCVDKINTWTERKKRESPK